MTANQKVLSYLLIPLSFTLGLSATDRLPSAFSEEAISPAVEAKVRTVAVVPICSAEKSAQQNDFTVEVAEAMTVYLQQGSSYKVMTQGEVSTALARIGLRYQDLTAVAFPEIAKGLPGNEIMVFVGPHPGEGPWFPCAVVRQRDMWGRRTYFSSSGPSNTTIPDFKSMGIETEIRRIFEAEGASR